MIVKEHINEGKLILALCDKNLLGKKIEDQNIQLDLSSSFYKGEEADIEELKKLIKKAYIINAVGKKAVEFLEKEGLIEKENIIYVKKIPHAQALVLIY